MADNENTTVLKVVDNATEKKDEIVIRPVKARDLFTVVRVVVPKLDMTRIRAIFSGMPSDAEARESYFRTAGMEMLSMVLGIVTEPEIQEWIADLAGMTLEQLMDSDIDTPFKIIQALSENQEIRKIFTTLLQ